MKKGQSLLALVLLMGSIVGMIGLTIALLANSFLDSGYGYQASATAEAAANSGAEDALLQLDRNPNFSNPTGYTLNVSTTQAMVSVAQDTPAINLIAVTSTATVGGRTRNVSVLVAKDASTTRITVVSWKEVQ